MCNKYYANLKFPSTTTKTKTTTTRSRSIRMQTHHTSDDRVLDTSQTPCLSPPPPHQRATTRIIATVHRTMVHVRFSCMTYNCMQHITQNERQSISFVVVVIILVIVFVAERTPFALHKTPVRSACPHDHCALLEHTQVHATDLCIILCCVWMRVCVCVSYNVQRHACAQQMYRTKTRHARITDKLESVGISSTGSII